MNKDLIIKHNELIEANYKISLQEQKLILVLAKEIKRQDCDFRKCNFTVNELVDVLGLSKNFYYSELKEITRSLISRVIQIKEPGKILQVSWLSSAEYFENQGRVELEFSEKLKPYLLQLGEHFTKLEFQQLVKLSSIYAIRIYELCKQYEKIKERTIEISKLKTILGLEKEKYKLYGHFKNKVLEIAEREINEKTDISIRIEEIKTGRKITALKFIIISAASSDGLVPTGKEKIEISEEALKLFDLLPQSEKIESNKRDLSELLKTHSFEMLKADIEYCKTQDISKGFWAYFISSTKRGHYSTKVIEKKKKVVVTQTQISFDTEPKIDYTNLTEAEKKGLEMVNKRILKK